MTTPTPRRLVVELPPLTSAQADTVFLILSDLMDAFWQAYEPELLDAAQRHATRDYEEQIEAEYLDQLLGPPPPTPDDP
jgi:hypothetical protein